MYRGFNLNVDFSDDKMEEFYKIGKSIFDEKKQTVFETLNKLLLTNGNINGTKMQEHWFPQVDADIFISHSHKDEKSAIVLAGWLYEVFNIQPFIDSCIWGNSNNLLRKIDNRFCKQDNGTYNYDKRNFSTTHVHMMLSVALNKMIDNTECLFFLNTPNSISTARSISQKTNSAWIYSEITMSKLIRRKKLKDYRISDGMRLFNARRLEAIYESFEYEVDLSDFTDIDFNDLNDWLDAYSNSREKYPLDVLYKLHSSTNIIGS